jgi:hypothetical protein
MMRGLLPSNFVNCSTNFWAISKSLSLMASFSYTPEMEFNFLELSKEIKSMFKYMQEPEDMDAMIQKLFWQIAIKIIQWEYDPTCLSYDENCPDCEAGRIIRWIRGHIELL